MRVSCQEIVISLRTAFASHKGVTRQVRQQILSLGYEGVTGHGSVRGASRAELGACASVLAGLTPCDLGVALERLTAARFSPPAIASVDIALHDLLGKLTGVSVRTLLGLDDAPVPVTAISIGACSDMELVRHARQLSDWPVIKLKLTASDDGRRVGFARAVYAGRIRVDGNGAWSRERAVRVAHELYQHGVEVLEQPTDAASIDDLAWVRERSPIPVFADELCHGPADVLALAGAASGVNIKLARCGGLRAAIEMITLARGAGLDVMLGCNLESCLGVTAIAQLSTLADHLDLDGHLPLRDDPFRGVEIEGGRIRLPSGPGLGLASTNLIGAA